MGPYPVERLLRGDMPDISGTTPIGKLSFRRPEAPENIVNAMREYQEIPEFEIPIVVSPNGSVKIDQKMQRSR